MVTALDTVSFGWVTVKWDSGLSNIYRMGAQNRYDLTSAPVKKPTTSSPTVDQEPPPPTLPLSLESTSDRPSVLDASTSQLPGNDDVVVVEAVSTATPLTNRNCTSTPTLYSVDRDSSYSRPESVQENNDSIQISSGLFRS